jgi:hypothetical protein
VLVGLGVFEGFGVSVGLGVVVGFGVSVGSLVFIGSITTSVLVGSGALADTSVFVGISNLLVLSCGSVSNFGVFVAAVLPQAKDTIISVIRAINGSR